MTIAPHQDPLFDGDTDTDAANAGAEAARRRRIVLAVEKAIGPGPVYQGVSKEIRRLTASGKGNQDADPIIDAAEHAGTIAAARQLARAIDKATGHNLTGWQANGRDVGPLFEQLLGYLERLHPTATGDDPFDVWLREADATAQAAPAAPRPGLP